MRGDQVFFFGGEDAILFGGSEIFYIIILAKMATRGQAQVDASFKDFAFVFPASEAVKNNSAKVLINHNVEMFEVGNL